MMKISIDVLSQAFVVGKKKIGPKSKSFLPTAAKYIISQISMGQSLSDFPLKFPVGLAEILSYIDENPALAEEYAKAIAIRATLLKENMIAMLKRYQNNPNSDNKELFQAASKAFESASKDKQEESVQIVFNEVLPKGFWEK